MINIIHSSVQYIIKLVLVFAMLIDFYNSTYSKQFYDKQTLLRVKTNTKTDKSPSLDCHYREVVSHIM